MHHIQGKSTPSQRFFEAGTGADPRSFSIHGDDEFYLFMDMRADKQWKSSTMTPIKWVEATQAFNTRLQSTHPSQYVSKKPRALIEKLGEVEGIILERIGKQNYQCEFPS